MIKKDKPACAKATARQSKIIKMINNRQEGVIVLENIADEHNAAAVWRSADAFGFQKIYLVFSVEKSFNPKRVGKKSSASANKWLSFKTFKSINECYKELKNEGYKIYATVLDEEARKIPAKAGRRETRFEKKKIALVFGNEHRGLSEEAIKGADEKIYIPMRGMVQSLNLSVTASILMYEVSRQRSASAKGYGETREGYKLSDNEKKELIKELGGLK